MKRIILLVILLLPVKQLFGQIIDRSYLGVKLGLNASTINKDPLAVGEITDYKWGFVGGFYYNYGLGKKISIQPEILYSQMGAEVRQSLGTLKYDDKLKLDYISVPLLFKVSPVWKIGIFAGPQFDFLINEEFGEFDVKGNYKNFSIAATTGLEYWITQKVGVYGRYVYGINDINDTGSSTRVFNRGFQFGLTIGLRSAAKTFEDIPTNPKSLETVGPVKTPSVIIDTDGDGISDGKDKCPTVPGIEKYFGCPIPDTDGDGINDDEDKCPKVAGVAKYQGCPIPDTDGDGVNDDEDKCPKLSGIKENLGCPEMILYYKKAESTLSTAYKAELDKVVQFLNNNPNLNVFIEGHTSTLGDANYNQKLSEKRAKSAVDYLVSKGINRSRLQAVGYGEQYPIGDNSKEEGRAKSRRTVVKIAK